MKKTDRITAPRLWMVIANYLPFIAYELFMLLAIDRQLSRGHDMPE